MIVFDIETKRSVADKKNAQGSLLEAEETFNGKPYEYAAHWKDYARMGIAVLACYNIDDDNMTIWNESYFDGFQKILDETDRFISYNGEFFDVPLSQWFGIKFDMKKSLDLHAVIHKQTGRRFKMGHIAKHNLGQGKVEDGADAPKMWQRGERFRVINYCMSDVTLTKKLFYLLRDNKGFKCPYTATFVKIDLPI